MKFLQKKRRDCNKNKLGKGLAFLLILSIALVITGCVNNEEGPIEDHSIVDESFYSFVDDIGQEIVLMEEPQTVAVLFSSYADVWVTAGGSVGISVGESVERGFASDGIVLVDEGAGKSIDTERLVAAKPDFVICSADIEAQVEAAKLLNENGIPAACFRVDTFGDYLHMLKICTKITGNEEAYQTYGMDVEERIQEIIAASKAKDEKKKILFVRAGSSASATKAKTAEENFVCVMLDELGTYNIADEASILLDGLSIEEILVQDPEYIFISTMGKEQEAIAYMDAVLQEPQWQALTAVKKGNYAYLPKDLFQYKPNARWDEAYAYLVDLLYE